MTSLRIIKEQMLLMSCLQKIANWNSWERNIESKIVKWNKWGRKFQIWLYCRVTGLL